jgi:hypothetical protein
MNRTLVLLGLLALGFAGSVGAQSRDGRSAPRQAMVERQVWVEERTVTVIEEVLVPETRVTVIERFLVPERHVLATEQRYVPARREWKVAEIRMRHYTIQQSYFVDYPACYETVEVLKCIPAHYEEREVITCIPAHTEQREVVKVIPGYFETVREPAPVEAKRGQRPRGTPSRRLG